MKEVVNMKNVRNVLWGIVLIAVGVIIALHAFGVADINIFFDGWWTLFIIIPSVIGLICERDKTWNLICLTVGVVLLLCARSVLEWGMMWKLVIPVVAVIVGIRMIFADLFKKKSVPAPAVSGNAPKGDMNASFGSEKYCYDGQVFKGADLSASFGAVACDARRAIINGDCIINANAKFGAVEILLPDNVNVVVKSEAVFGGVENKRPATTEHPFTVTVNANANFGGIEIK